jgi:hypothetical protein
MYQLLPNSALIVLPKGSRRPMAYTQVEWVPHSNQQKILYLQAITNQQVPHFSSLPYDSWRHTAYTFLSLVTSLWVLHFDQ